MVKVILVSISSLCRSITKAKEIREQLVEMCLYKGILLEVGICLKEAAITNS